MYPRHYERITKRLALFWKTVPKLSATLARRCTQGIIRDYFKISKKRLIDEINELQGKVDPLLWDAIDATRKIGNIGAHLEKDVNLILDIEPHEAQALIELIELLFKETYVAREERKKKLETIKEIANSLETQKSSSESV
jgi:hypothetical protein